MFKNKLKYESIEEVNKSEYKNKILKIISLSDTYKYKNELEFDQDINLDDKCNIDEKKEPSLLISKRQFNESSDDENKEKFQQIDKKAGKINDFLINFNYNHLINILEEKNII